MDRTNMYRSCFGSMSVWVLCRLPTIANDGHWIRGPLIRTKMPRRRKLHRDEARDEARDGGKGMKWMK